MWAALRVAGLSYVGVCLYALAVANRMIFLPQPPSYGDGPGVLKLDTSDGRRISAMHLRNPEAGLTVLYSHGNAEDLGDVLPFLEAMRKRGFSVMSYDYAGYGTSEGKPSEKVTYRDIEAAYAYLVGEAGVAPQSIIVHGRSVGGGVASHLAAGKPVGGLILESSFVSAFRVMTRYPLLPFDKFPNLRRIAKVDCPVLIIHGEADEMVPAWHGRKLFAKAREPKSHVVLPGARHNDAVWKDHPEYWQALEQFADLVRR